MILGASTSALSLLRSLRKEVFESVELYWEDRLGMGSHLLVIVEGDTVHLLSPRSSIQYSST